MTLIYELMERRGTPLIQQGKWATGPCPKCGGEDRFRVVANNGREYYSCRRCDAHGDAIQFLRDFEGKSFREAKELTKAAARTLTGETSMPQNIDDEGQWFEANLDIIENASTYLSQNKKAQDRLRQDRGINPGTAELFFLGYIPKLLRYDREDFGFSLRHKDELDRPIYIPSGFTIPILREEELYGVQIRRDEPYRDQRYFTIPGSELRPMVFRGKSTESIIVVESYLCGILVFQETKGRYTIVALGSASVRPDDDADSILRSAKTVLVALDSDAAGAQHAWHNWMGRYPNATRCPIPSRFGKDPTDAHLNGLVLEEWVNAGIALATERCAKETSRLLSLGKQRAKVIHIATVEDTQETIDEICEMCPAIGVAVHVKPSRAFTDHPQGNWHPRFAYVSHIAVYAKAMNKVFVFEMGAIKKRHLNPLWDLIVVCHDGVELLQHFAVLRSRNVTIESTLLMGNALTNGRMDIAEAFKEFTGDTLAVRDDPILDTAYRALALGTLLKRFRS